MTDEGERSRPARLRYCVSDDSFLKREQVWCDYLGRVAAADASALELFYDETHLFLYSVVQFILGNAADAEEITLEVYAYIWRSANAYDPRRGTVLTWLIMLGRSRALDRLRSRAVKGTEVQCTETLILTAKSLRDVMNIEQKILIERILERLSCEEREVIELAFYSGLSHHELALKLQLPLGTVKSRIRIALSRLRDFLSDGLLNNEPNHTRPTR